MKKRPSEMSDKRADRTVYLVIGLLALWTILRWVIYLITGVVL